MEGKEAIINKILSDAVAVCENMKQNAFLLKEKTVNNANIQAKEYTSKQRALLKEDAEGIIVKRNTLANLESRKELLKTKQELVSEVFGKAVCKLEQMPEKQYLDLLEKLINVYGEKGDAIIIADRAPVTAEEVETLPSAKSLGLKVKGKGDFRGGIILQNEKFDKKLSFDALVNNFKENYETEIADKLFGLDR